LLQEHQQKDQSECGGKKWQTDVLLEEEGQRKRRAGGEEAPARVRCGGILRQPLQKKNHEQDGEGAVAIVRGKRQDAVDAQRDERRGEQKRDGPGSAQAALERAKRDPPGQHGGQAADDGRIENVVEKNPSGEAHDGGLDEERERRVNQRKIAIGHLPKSDAKAGVQRVACVPQDGQMRVLPKNHGGAGQEERGGGEAVAEAPASLGQRRFELGRHGLGHREWPAGASLRPAQSIDFTARGRWCNPALPAAGALPMRDLQVLAVTATWLGLA
jgi:hypothetical protein